MVKFLTNRVISVAIVVLGAASANAELVKTPILQTFEDENGTVTESVGYKVTGLPNKEVAMVYTNHLRTATLRVRANLENVQFLVVGGGGGGGGGMSGPGGGGGGVVTGLVYKLQKNAIVDIKVGAGGMGGQKSAASGTVGGSSSVVVDGKSYVLAYGGGAGPRNAYGVDGGSGSGGGSYITTAAKYYTGGTALDAECAEGVLFAESFGHAGGSNGNSPWCSGGGGGAMGVGGDGVDKTGGNGGEGLKMDITGSLITYGSGGGGGGNGTKGTGGTNAGNGGNNSNGTRATSAKANCGGGGGGGGPNNFNAPNYIGYGGNGGSGIVVLRYKEPNTSGFKVIVR
jgi:hypothetical protein